MSELGFDDLRRANVVRCEESYHEVEAWSPTDWACALAGEVGEACNWIKKLRRLETSDLDTVAVLQTTEAILLVAEVQAELADAVIYADLLAARLGFDLARAQAVALARRKLARLVALDRRHGKDCNERGVALLRHAAFAYYLDILDLEGLEAARLAVGQTGRVAS